MAIVVENSQAMAALELANDVRLGMATIRMNIRAYPAGMARELVANLLEHPSGHVGSMPVGRLLMSCRGVGPTKAWKWSIIALCSVDRRVGELSEMQRKVLSELLRGAR